MDTRGNTTTSSTAEPGKAIGTWLNGLADSTDSGGSGSDAIDRRQLLRRTAVGAGATAAAMAAPSIAGIGTAPAFAQCASAGPMPIPEVACTSLPVMCDTTFEADLLASDVEGFGDPLVSGPLVMLLDPPDGSAPPPIIVSGPLTATIPAICPGQTITWNPVATIDLCAIYNTQLMLAISQVPGTATLTDFEVVLTNISIGGVAIPDFSQSGTTPIPSCAQDVTLPMLTASWGPVTDPTFDDATCMWVCPDPDQTFDDSVALTADLSVELSVSFGLFEFGGGATATISGDVPLPSACTPDFSAIISCL